MAKTKKPALKLTGVDGNIFVVLGKARAAATKAGWTKREIDAFLMEAKSGDYDHALGACEKWFDVS